MDERNIDRLEQAINDLTRTMERTSVIIGDVDNLKRAVEEHSRELAENRSNMQIISKYSWALPVAGMIISGAIAWLATHVNI